jgi:hypothetical protein
MHTVTRIVATNISHAKVYPNIAVAVPSPTLVDILCPELGHHLAVDDMHLAIGFGWTSFVMVYNHFNTIGNDWEGVHDEGVWSPGYGGGE